MNPYDIQQGLADSGLWCETPDGELGIIHVGIIRVDIIDPCKIDQEYWVVFPVTPGGYTKKQRWNCDQVRIRRDLPRAWNPDGTPPTKEDQ